MKLPYMRKPCADCPFRKDSMQGWLGEERMIEILNQPSFVCHKTTSNRLEDRKQCAGHMLLKADENAFVKEAKAINFDLGFTQKDLGLIFDNEKQCIEHHK